MPTDDPRYEDRTDPDLMDEAEYRAGWERATRERHPLSGDALDELIEEGCDRAELIKMMIALEEVPLHNPASRQDLVEAGEILAEAERKVPWLEFSDVAEQIFRNDDAPVDAEQLRTKIGVVVRRLEAQAPETDRRQRALHNDRIAALVRYVVACTGTAHDSRVSALVQAAINTDGVTFNENDLRQWRFRHRDLLA